MIGWSCDKARTWEGHKEKDLTECSVGNEWLKQRPKLTVTLWEAQQRKHCGPDSSVEAVTPADSQG